MRIEGKKCEEERTRIQDEERKKEIAKKFVKRLKKKWRPIWIRSITEKMRCKKEK